MEALTANPEVWARTVLLVNYDENDGFFDHVPPPAPPSTGLGASTVDTAGEYHTVRIDSEKTAERDDLMGRPYGLGPRVPLFVISPFARGGWVNSEVFDHTSVIRFLEKRFGVMEPNISAWRRAVCGDLTSCFDFKTPNAELAALPETGELAGKAGLLDKRTTPPTPTGVIAPVQATGVRRSRPLEYRLRADISFGQGPQITLMNDGSLAAVVQVHDCLQPGKPPRRYTIGAGEIIDDDWPAGPYDVFMTGPNGFHCRFVGTSSDAAPVVSLKSVGRKLRMEVTHNARVARELTVTPNAYADKVAAWKVSLSDRSQVKMWDLDASSGWYDFTVRYAGLAGWSRRYAGRIDDGSPTMTDPAMGGAAVMSWS